MTELSSLSQRSRMLLSSARFMTLATVTPRGEPWASTVNYVCQAEPLKVIWYSSRDAMHSLNITSRADVSASVFRCDLGDASPIGLDGGQLFGECRVIVGAEVEEVHRHYYERNFPDVLARRQWMLPTEQFHGEGPRRFYELSIMSWWLFDIEQWLQDRRDRRIEVPLSDLISVWPGA
ncbi:pyridoxamine 5'-phosphate oxidase family protein [Pseudomonas sp. 91RF]|jgi:uncharacterized protein YhbP (UPF0306 family)|uniref:pyridoxamine 5'-phosphate oxidase family protein n=1 Tax=Pseudomonas sp. 91RF TaxID=2292261 RepID=UPI000E662252|nr:pyridoxamine 5'-phosphate oxidase family protein [Pseudomonas sp. 91RF]RIJ12855.1 pyridoxamine 5'-phosphate oxidase family protein [Pseudomonas sp. 91RF]